MSPKAQQEVKDIMNNYPTCVGRFPGDLRPDDALGGSCHMHVVIDSASNSILQFFHSSVPLPWGVVKAFCRGSVLVLNDKIVNNSDRLKCGVLMMLSEIKGDQWLTQYLAQKIMRRTSKSEKELDTPALMSFERELPSSTGSLP